MELFQAGEQDFLGLQDFYKNLIAKTLICASTAPGNMGFIPRMRC